MKTKTKLTTEELVRQLLVNLGEDPRRPDLVRTPERVAQSLTFLTRGYAEDPAAIFRDAVYPASGRDMVVMKSIELYSLFEHHLLPFWGQCHFGYIPDKHICGASKIPRLIDHFARRLQQQERLTSAIAAAFIEQVKPLGVAVVIEAQHLCMMMRGVEKQNSRMQTSCMRGVFQQDQRTRAEFLSLIRP